MSRAVKTGSMDQSIRVWAYDSDGAAITGEAYNSAGIAVSVVVRSAGRIVSSTALTLVARTTPGEHRDNAFTEVGSGEYVVDLADSYSATANRQVSVTLTSDAIAGGYVLSETLDVGVTSVGTGTGARTVTITVNDGTTALQNARVRLTEGANTFRGLTNASGVVTFNVDDETYTVAITKSGYSYSGTTLVVDADETVSYSMTAITVTPPDDPALCAVTIPILDQYGAALADEVVEIRFNEFTSTADTTALVLSPPPTLTSDAEGLIEVNLLREAKYSVFYGQDDYKRRLDFTVPDAGSFTVGE